MTGRFAVLLKRAAACLAVGAIAGALLGVLDVWRHSPVFRSDRQLETAWVLERRPRMKDQYLMFLFGRNPDAISKSSLKHLLPSLLSLDMRLERYDRFIPALKIWASQSEDKATVLALSARWAEDFLRIGDRDRMSECRNVMERFRGDADVGGEFAARSGRLDFLDDVFRLQNLLLMKSDAAGAAIPEIEELFGRVERILKNGDPSGSPVDVVRLLNAAGPAVNGIMDRLGDTLAARVAASWDIQSAIELSILADELRSRPDRRAEWERWIRRMEMSEFLPLRCVADLSDGFLLWARDGRPEAAHARLIRDVVLCEPCPREIQDLAARRAVEACPACGEPPSLDGVP